MTLGVDDGARTHGMLAEHTAIGAVLGDHLNADNRRRHLGDGTLDFGTTALGFIRTSQQGGGTKQEGKETHIRKSG